MRRRTFFGGMAAFGALLAERTDPVAAAEGATPPAPTLDLKRVERSNLVRSMRLSKGAYLLETADGSRLRYPERDVRVKTDASGDGPRPGAPALIRSGMRGDRVYVVFAAPSEISTFIETVGQREVPATPGPRES